MTSHQIDQTFTYHAPTQEQIAVYADLRERGRELAHFLNSVCPESREKSLALTRLQECIQMANAAIAIHNGPARPEDPYVGYRG